MKPIYNLWYRFGNPPWVLGPRKELVELVEGGRLRPCRAIDLGCGTGDNAIFLAQRGFDVTALDYSSSAIDRARQSAARAGVQVDFRVDDLTRLRGDYGTFDLLVDYGALHSLTQRNRDAYLRSVVPLARAGAQFLIFCHEWRSRWWERLLGSAMRAGVSLRPGEAQERFGRDFELELVNSESFPSLFSPSYAAYLMTRRQAAAQSRAPSISRGNAQ
jgi:cyclopropane fatty-acyl-phospholipid synthase-like methyltransferase